MKKIILVSGKQGSGKTTLRRNLDTLFNGKAGYVENEKVMGLKFADPLYEMHDAIAEVADRYGIPFDKKEGVLLQLLGTEWGRKVKGPDVWVNALKFAIENDEFPHEIFVIDDCRFKNELTAFPHAFKVRLIASEKVREARADSWRSNTAHPSEIDLDDVDDDQFHLVIDTETSTKEETANLVYLTANHFWGDQ